MLIEQTLDKLNAMKLGAMAEAVQQQLRADDVATLSFEERLGLLVDTEWTAREQRKLTRRLQTAQLRYAARSRPSTSPTPAGSTASRSSPWAAAPGLPTTTICSSPPHGHRQELPRLCLR